MNAFLRTDFDEFLLAKIGEDASGMPLTLLSVLARLGIDPWEEAADLAHLPLEPATQRLASRLEAIPHGPAPGADTVSTAARLIALLHRAPKPTARAPGVQPLPNVINKSKGVNVAFYYLVGLILMLIAQWAMATSHPPAATQTTLAPDPRE
jgi:hypothetical protein